MPGTNLPPPPFGPRRSQESHSGAVIVTLFGRLRQAVRRRSSIYATVAQRHPDAEVIVPPRSTAVLSDDVEATPTQRDRHLQSIAAHGRIGWQKRSGYTRRALVESGISRLKRVIGDALRSRTDRRRTTEVAIAVHALNRMLEFGRPKSIRTT